MRALLLTTALLSLGGCTLPPTLARLQSEGAVAPVRSDLARVYVFRNSSGPPVDLTVYIDGAPAGVSEMGRVFERDVAPGDHVVSTDLEHPAAAEIASLSLAPGSTVYLAVDDNFVNDDTQATRVVVYSIAPIDERRARPMAERLPFQSPGGGAAAAGTAAR